MQQQARDTKKLSLLTGKEYQDALKKLKDDKEDKKKK